MPVLSDISVICVNDGMSILAASVEAAHAEGWLVYPSSSELADGVRMGMCPGCNEDAYESGAYI